MLPFSLSSTSPISIGRPLQRSDVVAVIVGAGAAAVNLGSRTGLNTPGEMAGGAPA